MNVIEDVTVDFLYRLAKQHKLNIWPTIGSTFFIGLKRSITIAERDTRNIHITFDDRGLCLAFHDTLTTTPITKVHLEYANPEFIEKLQNHCIKQFQLLHEYSQR